MATYTTVTATVTDITIEQASDGTWHLLIGGNCLDASGAVRDHFRDDVTGLLTAAQLTQLNAIVARAQQYANSKL